MLRHRFAPIALVLLLVHGAQAASLTPPNLVTASSLANQDLLLVWPYAAGGPLEAMSWAAFAAQMQAAIGGGFLKPANNLSDLGNQTVARTNLGLGTAATVNTGTSGATLCLANAACTRGALTTFPASTTGGPSLNIPPGVAPTSPTNGDMWTTSSGIFAQINGASEQLGAVTSGTWAPNVTFSTPGNLSVSYGSQIGSYIRVTQASGASECTVHFFVSATPTYTTASGTLLITNLPFNAFSSSFFWESGMGAPIGNNTGLRNLSTNTVFTTMDSGSGIGFAMGGTAGGVELTTSNTTSGTALILTGGISYRC